MLRLSTCLVCCQIFNTIRKNGVSIFFVILRILKSNKSYQNLVYCITSALADEPSLHAIVNVTNIFFVYTRTWFGHAGKIPFQVDACSS